MVEGKVWLEYRAQVERWAKVCVDMGSTTSTLKTDDRMDAGWR